MQLRNADIGGESRHIWLWGSYAFCPTLPITHILSTHYLSYKLSTEAEPESRIFIQRMSWGRALRRRGMREAGWGREPVSKNRATMSLALAWSDRAHRSSFRIHPTWGKRGTPASLSLSVDGPPWPGWRALWGCTMSGEHPFRRRGPWKEEATTLVVTKDPCQVLVSAPKARPLNSQTVGNKIYTGAVPVMMQP